MSHTGHTCIHWTTNLTSLCPSLDEEVTCSRLQDLPDLWVRCRAAEVKMEGPDSQPPQISPPLPPPTIAAEAPHQSSPPPQTSPTSPLQSLPHTPLRHSPIPHTPITPHTPLPHTPLTPHSPLTPLTSQSTLASEASVDSGVASAHSLDMLHNSCSSFETHALRRRAGSSVSSGTSEGWLGSLDGDPAGLEVLPELWPHSESPTAQGHSLPPSHNSPASSEHSPSASHHSPTQSCHSPVTMHHSPTTTATTTTTTTTTIQYHLPPSSEAADINKAVVPGDCQDSERHSLSPRNNPKEAFSSVIPLHPSALSPHTSPLRPGVVQARKMRQNFMITVNSAPVTESQCRQVFTDFGCTGNEAFYENKFCYGKDNLIIQENCGLNGVLRKMKEAHHSPGVSEVEQMARECVWIDKFASLFVKHIIEEALSVSSYRGWSIKCSGQCQREQCRQEYQKKESSWWSVGGGKGNRKSSIPLLGLSCGSPGLCWTPELPYSPSHRPHSRSSLGSSLSFSHDSLVSSGPRMDDSHLITGAVSHDALLFPTSKASHSDVSDIYNVPLDGDIYAVPVDVVKPKEGQILHPKAIIHHPKKRHHRRHAKNNTNVSATLLHDSNSKKVSSFDPVCSTRPAKDSSVSRSRQHSGQSVTSVSGGDILKASKRHSVPSNIGCALSMTPKHSSSKENHEPIHMTLEEVRKSFHESDDTINCNKGSRVQQSNKNINEQSKICRIIPFNAMKSCKRKDSTENRLDDNRKKGRSISSNIRNTLITIFGLKKGTKSSGTRLKSGNCVDAATQGFSETAGNGTATLVCSPTSGPQHNHTTNSASTTVTRNHQNSQQNHHSNHRHSNGINTGLLSCLGNLRAETDEQPVSSPNIPTQTVAPSRSPAIVTNRALPPLPLPTSGENETSPKTPEAEIGGERREEEGCDFASIIEKVKDCGWYWGPISGEAAEKVLANEPDGSFIVRDSSDHHYIFSLTFKLNGFIRHVRIEHDQGNFSFGGFTKFKSQTIVEFIENAVEHSRSGRYLFFLHRRPILGPMRVQLLHPVSRFKHIQSLQHLCRFVIVKHVRRDLISELPLPQRLKDYLCSPHYYSERVEQCMAAAAAAASDNEDSASSGVADEGNGVPSQVLHPSLGELDDNLPVLPGLMPSFPGVPQPVMDRASQTSQATSPNPPLSSQDQPLDNIHTCSLQETDSTHTVSSTLQDADHLTSSTAQSFSEPNHHAVISPVRVDENSRTATTTYSPTCCSPAHVEPETYPACSQVTQTSQAHTASASPAPQGNLAFAHQHTTSASGRLSLNSSTSDVQDNTSSLNDRALTLSESSPSDADRIIADATVSREYFRINPCRGLEDHVFEDLGGV